MKYLIINGSPNKASTYNAATEFMRNISMYDADVQIDEVHLKQIDIPFCAGCYSCFEKGEQFCPHKNVALVAEKIHHSDFIIITSPVYSLNLSALLKNYIDHMSYNYHRPVYFTKKALVISSTVGAGAGSVTKYIRDVLKFWGFNRVYKFSFNGTSPDIKELPAKAKQRISSHAPKIYANLKSGKLDKPSIKRVFFFNAWRAIAAAGKDTSPDRQYWANNDMSTRLYHSSVKIGPVKKLIGILSFALFKKLI